LRERTVRILATLLLLSIVTEVLAEVNIYKKINYYAYYHIFTLAEYTLISLVLRNCVESAIFRRVMLISIPVFIVGSTLIICFIQDVSKMPSISGGIEGILIMLWCLRVFHDLRVSDRYDIFSNPSFWLGLAFFSYYIIVTPFNSVFNILQEDETYGKLSTKMFSVINSIANYLLYSLCMISFYCLKRARSIRRS
jgi:hypothetical protein